MAGKYPRAVAGAILVLATAGSARQSAASGEHVNGVYENPVDVRVTQPQLTPRPEPLRDFPVERVLDLTDFGAVPDDEGNDVAGIRAAMKLATEAKVPIEVRFPKGRFVLTAHALMEVGARVLVFDPKPGEKLGAAKVVSVQRDRLIQRVKFDGPIRGVRTGSEKTDPQFFNIDSSGGFVFRNSTFRNIRRFGILIDSRDGLIENNRFEATSSNGVVIHNDPDWPEGFATGNVIIRGNTFDNCNVEMIHRAETSASIVIETNRLGWQLAPYQGIADILIEDNTFVNWRNQGIAAGCLENAIIRKNRFLNYMHRELRYVL